MPTSNDNAGPYWAIRNAAWVFATSQLRNTGIRPNPKLVRNLANAGIRQHLRSSGIHIPLAVQATVANDVSRAVMRGWDPDKARPAAKVPRAKRAVEDRDILLALRNEGGLPRSVRGVATMLGVSPSRVQRAKMKSCTIERPTSLSNDAMALLAVIDEYTPPDAKRIFDLGQLFGVAEVDIDRAGPTIKEINAAPVATTIMESALRSAFGASWVVARRGRTESGEKLLSWLQRSEDARQKGDRNSLRFDQRRYAIYLNPIATNPVQRDLLAANDVALQTRSLKSWRDFIYASIETSPDVDREAIVTVAQSMLRLSEIDIVEGLAKAENWVVDGRTRARCKTLFQLARDVISTLEHRGPKIALDVWCEGVDYRNRIDRGYLPGRSLEVLEALMGDYSPEKEQWLLKMPSLPSHTAAADPINASDHPKTTDPQWEGWDDVPDFLRDS